MANSSFYGNNPAVSDLQTAIGILAEVNSAKASASASAISADASASQAEFSKNASAGSATFAQAGAASALVSENAAAASALAALNSQNSASASASTTTTKASEASISATNASSSASSALISATNAATSATAAQTAHTRAESAQAGAQAARTAAEAARDTADGHKTAAATSETNAAQSASSSLSSMNAAAISETNAASSAASALSSKDATSTSETNATASAAAALTSQNAAAASASAAANSAAVAASFDPSSYVLKTGGAYTGAVTVNSGLRLGGSSNSLQIANPLDNTAARVLDLDITGVASMAADVRVFRSTNTTGARRFSIYRGDGTATSDHTFYGGNAGTVATLASNGGSILIGATGDADSGMALDVRSGHIQAKAVSGNAALYLSSAATSSAQLTLRTASSNRWVLQRTSGTESGSNIGSDFSIVRYDDSGAVLGNPLTISRSTGVTTFAARPVFGAATPWDSANFDPATKASLSGGTFTGGVELQNVWPTLALTNIDGAALTRRVYNGRGEIGFLGPDNNYKLWVNDAGQVWTAQFGDLGARIEDRAGAHAEARAAAHAANKLVKTGDTMTGPITHSYAYPQINFYWAGVKHTRWIMDAGGNMLLQDGGGQNHFYVSPGGAVWTQQVGDLGTHINNRAWAYANDAEVRGQNYTNSSVGAIDYVHRVRFVGYGESGDAGWVTDAPNVVTDCHMNMSGFVSRRWRTLQYHLPRHGGWHNVPVE